MRRGGEGRHEEAEVAVPQAGQQRRSVGPSPLRHRPALRASACGSSTTTRPRASSMTRWSWSRCSTWLTEGRVPPTRSESWSWVKGIRRGRRRRRRRPGEAEQAAVDPTVEADVHRLEQAVAQLAHAVGERSTRIWLTAGNSSLTAWNAAADEHAGLGGVSARTVADRCWERRGAAAPARRRGRRGPAR